MKLLEGSFSLYLIHPMVLDIAPGIWKKFNNNSKMLYMIFQFILCIGMSYLINYGLIQKLEILVYNKYTHKKVHD